MFGVFKVASPTDLVVKYNRKGERVVMGVGIAPFKGLWNKFALVPTSVRNVPFSFREVTSDLLRVAIIGNIEITIDVSGDKDNPPKALELYDFVVDPRNGAYNSRPSPLEVIDDRVLKSIRKYVRDVISYKTLSECIREVNNIQDAVKNKLANMSPEDMERSWGIELGSFSINSVEPEQANLKEALEAPVREQLLGEADEAIAKRQEESAKLARQLALYETETQKEVAAGEAEVVTQQGKNDNLRAKAEAKNHLLRAKAEAESEIIRGEAEAEALKQLTNVYKDVPTDKLLAMSVYKGEFSPDQLIITPDMITQLLASIKK